MSDIDSRQAEEAAFIDTLYGDPIRPATVKAGRNLIIASLLLAAVMKFGARIQSTTLFPISFDRPDVLPTVLAILILLLLANFLSRILTDFGLFLEGERRIKRFIWRVKEAAAVQAAQEVDSEMDGAGEGDDPSEPDPWWEPVVDVRNAAKRAEESIAARLGRSHAVRLVRQLRAGGEVTVPIILAVVALLLSAPRWQWPA